MALQDNEAAVKKFKELVLIKREQMELKDKYDVLKEYFKTIADNAFPDGEGELELMEGKGVRFEKKKSSISKRKLVEQGVAEDVIGQATGEYIGFDIFS